MQNDTLNFWEDFKSRRNEFANLFLPKIYHFCNDKVNTNLCAQLTVDGIKTATCSAKILYDFEREALPKIGDVNIITNWKKEPICVIQITKVELKKFEEIDEAWAIKEGEGDFSLSFWKIGHEKIFRTALKEYGLEFQTDLLLVCEEFEKL